MAAQQVDTFFQQWMQTSWKVLEQDVWSSYIIYLRVVYSSSSFLMDVIANFCHYLGDRPGIMNFLGFLLAVLIYLVLNLPIRKNLSSLKNRYKDSFLGSWICFFLSGFIMITKYAVISLLVMILWLLLTRIILTTALLRTGFPRAVVDFVVGAYAAGDVIVTYKFITLFVLGYKVARASFEVKIQADESDSIKIPGTTEIDMNSCKSAVAVGTIKNGKFNIVGQATCINAHCLGIDGVADTFLTATHIVKAFPIDDLYIWRNGVAVKVGLGLQCDPDGLFDIYLLRVRDGASKLGVSPAKVANFPLGKCAGTLFSISTEGLLQSVGMIKIATDQEDSNYTFIGNTIEGWSGSGLYVSGALVGMHTVRLGTDKKLNAGYDISWVPHLVRSTLPLQHRCKQCNEEIHHFDISEGFDIPKKQGKKGEEICLSCDNENEHSYPFEKKGKNKSSISDTWDYLDRQLKQDSTKVKKTKWGLENLYAITLEKGKVYRFTDDELDTQLGAERAKVIRARAEGYSSNSRSDYFGESKFEGKGPAQIDSKRRPIAPVDLHHLQLARLWIQNIENTQSQVSGLIRALSQLMITERRNWEASESEEDMGKIIQTQVDIRSLQLFLEQIAEYNFEATELYQLVEIGSNVDITLKNRVERQKKSYLKEHPLPTTSPDIDLTIDNADRNLTEGLEILRNIPKRLTPEDTASVEAAFGPVIAEILKRRGIVAQLPMDWENNDGMDPEFDDDDEEQDFQDPRSTEQPAPSKGKKAALGQTTKGKTTSAKSPATSTKQSMSQERKPRSLSRGNSQRTQSMSNLRKLEKEKQLKAQYESILSYTQKQKKELESLQMEISDGLLKESSAYFRKQQTK
ncbi:hypothetical protein 1 [Beihai sobemo-like virus 12]|uniref:hypothetical protein 1 n=1 Tax=Beihai sobemo-like virus 12 TaxID=1922683 RepID=UPI000909CEAC|nr:hypothetical protein 1 [Beihai sobemo-like virus 12]APG75734.1 hypothetical protein 1 [Beihai sobemo-like virus 12]